MLRYEIFKDIIGKGLILKVIESTMSVTKTESKYFYFFLWIETGYWYKLNVCPNYTEKDDIAITKMEVSTRKCKLPSVPPVEGWYDKKIRDTYLPSVSRMVSGMDLLLFTYNSYKIWAGYATPNGFYVVTDEHGNNAGTQFYSFRDAMLFIDTIKF